VDLFTTLVLSRRNDPFLRIWQWLATWLAETCSSYVQCIYNNSLHLCAFDDFSNHT